MEFVIEVILDRESWIPKAEVIIPSTMLVPVPLLVPTPPQTTPDCFR